MEFTRCMVTLLLLLCLVDHLLAVFEADFYACPGETVTLSCDGPADKDTNVVWIFGSRTIYSFKNGISKCEHPHFVNRIQLGSIQQNNFSLVIYDVRVQDHGGYKCLINGAVMQRNRLSVKGSRKRRAAETPPADHLDCNLYENKDKEVLDENPPGAPSSVWLIVILSVIVGIVVILVLVGIAGILWFRRRRNQTEPTPTPEAVPLSEMD